jgi:uncharacterized GH25 family protein
VRDMKLISPSGATDVKNVHLNGKEVEGEVRIAGTASYILTARTIPNVFQLGANEFNAYLREEGLEEAIFWRKEHGEAQNNARERYSKYAKALLTAGGSNELHAQAVGFLFEIVPEKSPYELQKGESLPVRILLRGKPASHLQVETSWAVTGTKTKTEIVGRTDVQGRIVIPHPTSGKWRIHSVSIERCEDPRAADWESNWASLTFEIR